MKSKIKSYYFFLGTVAELIKIVPIVLEFEKGGVPYNIISTGQNNIQDTDLFGLLKKEKVDFLINQKKILQTPFGLLIWFLETFIKTLPTFFKISYASLKNNRENIMIVHGDTVSTLMGAILGRVFGFRVAHIEAGLRSFNLLQPFPEEITRVIVSKIVQIHFCPNSWAINNLKNTKGKKINTEYNTLVDSLEIALKQDTVSKSLLSGLKKSPYFVFVMHRAENLTNVNLVRIMVDLVLKQSNQVNCLFVVHGNTKVVLESLGLYSKLKKKKNIMLVDRVPYFDFMKVLQNCEFIITDGGSNQEECSYFGKPCLLLRNYTERIEGLGENAVLSKNDPLIIENFVLNYKSYSKKLNSRNLSPSKVVFKALTNLKN